MLFGVFIFSVYYFMCMQRNYRPVEKLLKYMLDVSVGMHYIAEKGLVHRVSLQDMYTCIIDLYRVDAVHSLSPNIENVTVSWAGSIKI